MPNSRNKGHAYERQIAERLRAIWPEVVTSRSESKRLDDAGVDLCYTPPFNFQCKAVEKLSPGVHDILAGMPQGTNHNAVIWKRNHKGSVVCLPLEDFWELIELMKREKLL